ncbi:membrane protein [Thraustotheca clavata]|uniref:Membrane protein n=1 Tax=Thraustotheca clavata TaxID=74557 RepID=A0A1W0ABV3_9STRA|nr:membrane protein [Thraustotheca clavata]
MVFIDIVLPIIVYAIMSTKCSEVLALTCSGIPPVLESLYHWYQYKSIDIIGICVILSLIVSATVAAITSDARLLLVKDSFTTMGAGLLSLGSLCIGKENLIWYYNRQFSGDEAKDRLDALYAKPEVRQATRLMCWVWGVALIFEAFLRLVLIFIIPVYIMVYISTIIMATILSLLLLWSALYVKRVRRRHPHIFDEPTKEISLDIQIEKKNTSVL